MTKDNQTETEGQVAWCLPPLSPMVSRCFPTCVLVTTLAPLLRYTSRRCTLADSRDILRTNHSSGCGGFQGTTHCRNGVCMHTQWRNGSDVLVRMISCMTDRVRLLPLCRVRGVAALLPGQPSIARDKSSRCDKTVTVPSACFMAAGWRPARRGRCG